MNSESLYGNIIHNVFSNLYNCGTFLWKDFAGLVFYTTLFGQYLFLQNTQHIIKWNFYKKLSQHKLTIIKKKKNLKTGFPSIYGKRKV